MSSYLQWVNNRNDLVVKGLSAIVANETFLALPSPTNAQVLAQVQRLTRECTALIRIMSSSLDSTSGS